MLREGGLEHPAAFFDQRAVGQLPAPPLQQRERRQLPVADASRRVVAEIDHHLPAGFGGGRDLGRLLGRDHPDRFVLGLRLGDDRGDDFGLRLGQILEQRLERGLGLGVGARGPDGVDAHPGAGEPHGMAGAGAGGGGHGPDRQAEREQRTEERERAEDHTGADLAGGGGHGDGDGAPEHTSGVAQGVERAVERGLPVGEVQDGDVGDEQEHRADPDPHEGPFGRLVVLRGAVRARRGRPPRPQQHHGEGDAGHRDRHPGATEEGAGAVGERGPDRPGQVGPEAEGAEHADHHESDGGGVGAVADELAGRRGAALRQRAGPLRGRARPGRGPALGPLPRRRLGFGARATPTPRLGGRHPRTLTPSTPAPRASARPHAEHVSLRCRLDTSIDTCSSAGGVRLR